MDPSSVSTYKDGESLASAAESEQQNVTLTNQGMIKSKANSSSQSQGEKEERKPKRRRKEHTEEEPCTTSEFLSERAQGLVNEINAKRNNDTALVRDFKKAMEREIENYAEHVEKALFKVCEKNSSIIQNKLQELYCIIDEIEKLERELLQFKDSLSALYSEVQRPEQ